MLALLAGCATTAPEFASSGEIALVYIESARFCSRPVETHSDFAYIRPSTETVIGNSTCSGEDGMGDAPVVWWRQEGAGRWTPPPDIERTLRFALKYRKGATAVPKAADAMEALLAAAVANPRRDIRLTSYTEAGEKAQIAERRAEAVRSWLKGRGVDPRRVIVGSPGLGAPRVEAEIVVVIKG